MQGFGNKFIARQPNVKTNKLKNTKEKINIFFEINLFKLINEKKKNKTATLLPNTKKIVKIKIIL